MNLSQLTKITVLATALSTAAGAQDSTAGTQPIGASAASNGQGISLIGVESRTDFLKSLPGNKLHHHLRRRRSEESEDQAEDRKEDAAEQMERFKRQRAQRSLAIERAGGWQQAFLGEVNHELEVLPPSADATLLSEQVFINSFGFCESDTPQLALEMSTFPIDDGSTFSPGNITGELQKDGVVEPLATITILGCSLGSSAGKAQVVFTPNVDGGGFSGTLDLDINNWSPNGIEANLKRSPGIADQQATLVVTTANGNQATLPVQFFQHRVITFFNPAQHLDVVAANQTNHTTFDHLVAIPEFPPGFGGGHYTFCCSAVFGTDHFFFKLKNGWQLPVGPLYLITDAGFEDGRAVLFSRSPVTIDFINGVTECGLFTAGPGDVTGTSFTNNPQGAPGLNAEVDVRWFVNANCSGVQYTASVLIIGPDGFPYD